MRCVRSIAHGPDNLGPSTTYSFTVVETTYPRGVPDADANALHPDGDLPPDASVVVVGGGVMGVSIAFHLAEAGVRDVLLLDRAALGSGSTCKAAGGVRAQFSDPLNVQLGARSLDAFERFRERPGQEIDLHQVGYLFLLSDEASVTAFEQATAMQRELGVDSRMVTPAEVAALCPLVRTDDLLAAAWSPRRRALHARVGRARVRDRRARSRRDPAHRRRRHRHRDDRRCRERRGHLARHRPHRHGRVRGRPLVRGRRGHGRCATCRSCPYRRQVLFTEPVPGLPQRLPMTIDFATTYYFHGEGGGLLMGMSDPDEPPSFRLDTDDAWLPRLTDAMAGRAPGLLDVGVTGGWAGLYEVTPDHNALIGTAASTPGFVYATGFSGHGFLQAPAVGEVVRDLVLGRQPFVDVTPLSVDRFAGDGSGPDGQARPEVNLV